MSREHEQPFPIVILEVSGLDSTAIAQAQEQCDEIATSAARVLLSPAEGNLRFGLDPNTIIGAVGALAAVAQFIMQLLGSRGEHPSKTVQQCANEVGLEVIRSELPPTKDAGITLEMQSENIELFVSETQAASGASRWTVSLKES